MKVIKLEPAFKDYLWGGEKLKKEFNKKTDMKPLSESWELSCHKNGLSKIAGTQITLLEHIEKEGKEILGKNAKKFENFPVLIKLIDAKDNLSVQVHPSDKYALEYEGQYGKTEAWYILSAEKDATIIFGLNKKVTKEEFRKSIEENTLLDIVNTVPVNVGDLFFVEPGTLHAIGKGIVIAEIQQNSDVTYRVYDYGRKDASGNERELHVDKACEVVNFDVTKDENSKRASESTSVYENLVDCKYFKLSKINVNGEYDYKVTEDSFVDLLCVSGQGQIIEKDGVTKVKKGDSLFLPAGDYSIKISGECTVLETRV